MYLKPLLFDNRTSLDKHPDAYLGRKIAKLSEYKFVADQHVPLKGMSGHQDCFEHLELCWQGKDLIAIIVYALQQRAL